MRQLKEKVLWCLKNFPETRNSDIKLTNCIWFHYYEGNLFKNEAGDLCVRLIDIYKLPHEDHVRRIRAKIQNEEKLYLPTDPEVRRQRKIREEEWLKSLGYA